MNKKLIIIICLFLIPLFTVPISVKFPRFLLRGTIERVELPEFSANSFFDKSFQSKFDKWFSRNFGLRSLFININNQIYYSLFKKSYTDTIVGKKGYLYASGYIEQYLNTDINKADLTIFVDKLKKIQAELDKKGVYFAVLITPSKATFYPQYIPDRYFRDNNVTSESKRYYDALLDMLNSSKINYIDSIAYLKKQKEPVFSKGGVHWNEMGKFYGTEFFVQSLEKSLNKNLPTPVIKTAKWDYFPKGEDKDLAVLLNAIIPPVIYKTVHVSVEKKNEKNVFRPNMTLVGNSFNWGLIDNLSAIKFYRDFTFLYYLRRAHVFYKDGVQLKRIGDPVTKPEEYLKEALKKDVVVLELNESIINTVNNKDNYIKPFTDEALKVLSSK